MYSKQCALQLNYKHRMDIVVYWRFVVIQRRDQGNSESYFSQKLWVGEINSSEPMMNLRVASKRKGQSTSTICTSAPVWPHSSLHQNYQFILFIYSCFVYKWIKEIDEHRIQVKILTQSHAICLCILLHSMAWHT